jgi:hypothetical protein
LGDPFGHLSPRRPDLGGQEAPVARRLGEEHHVIDREAVDDPLQLVARARVFRSITGQVERDEVDACQQQVDGGLPEAAMA